MPALSLPDATGPHAAVQIVSPSQAMPKTPSGTAVISPSPNLTTARGLTANAPAPTTSKAKFPVVPDRDRRRRGVLRRFW